MTTPMKEEDEPDFLEKEIAERTARNPDYPRLLAEAERRQACARCGKPLIPNHWGEINDVRYCPYR